METCDRATGTGWGERAGCSILALIYPAAGPDQTDALGTNFASMVGAANVVVGSFRRSVETFDANHDDR